MSPSGHAVQVGLLGTVEVGAGARVGSPQLRHVLAALAVDVGRPVSTEALVDRVWDKPPAAARHALHVHIAGLRRLLEQATTAGVPAGRVVRRAGCYVLDIDRDQVDLFLFRGLRARADRPDCPDKERAALLSEAIRLWRGQPLAGLPGAWAERMRRAWRQEYLDAVVAWADAELSLGHPGAVVSALTDLAGEYPLAESLAGSLMRALHAAGRAADALDRYELTRRRLAEELGADPGAELQRLYDAILHDDHLGPARAPAAGQLPAQLPTDVTGFAGRGEQLALLDRLAAEAGERPTTSVICAIAGTAGVGKTTLAVHLAHRVRRRFPDGQLYVNLRGFDPGGSLVDPGDAVRGFLDALEVAPQRLPADLPALVALYRSVLAGRRMLIVVDNARDADQVRPLLPGTGGCLVLVTGRNKLTSLVASDGAHPLTLGLLTDDEARDLLTRRLGPDRVAAEPAAVEKIIARCARLPLALAIVAAHAVTQPTLPLTALADQLRGSHDRLDVLATGDPTTDPRDVFSWSYQRLTPAAARLFRLLGVHPGPDTSLPAAASLAALPQSRARPLLTELTRANLLNEPLPGRYTLHDLLRAYATEQAHIHDDEDARHAAVHRMLDHYLHTAHTAARLLDPHREQVALAPPQPGVTPERPTDHGSAMTWFTAEHAVLLAAIRIAADAGFDTHTWQLAWSAADYLNFQGHWHDWAATQQAALTAADRAGNRSAQAWAHRLLGFAYVRLGRSNDSFTQFQHALDLFSELDDRVGQARTHLPLAFALDLQGHHRQALDHGEQALELSRAGGTRIEEAIALNAVGWYHGQLGNHSQALTCCQQALSLHQEHSNRDGEAATWDSLGYIHHLLGHHERAVDCYQHALDVYRELRNRYAEADTLTRLADTQHAAGDGDAARGAWLRALNILTDLNHPAADAVRAKLRPAGSTGRP